MRKLTCSQCNSLFERKKVDPKSKHYFCSSACQYKYKQITQSDEYTMFRMMFSKTRHSAKRKGFDFDLSLEQLSDLWRSQEGRCKLSDLELHFGETRDSRSHGDITASLDRIDSAEGYVPENVQYVHKVINDLKSDMPEDMFISLCMAVARKNKDRPEIDLSNLGRSLYNTGNTRGDNPSQTPF